MTTKHIKAQIDRIRASSWDYEKAHAIEDQLREDFIRYVSTLNIPSLAAKANLVLATSEIPFSRHCA